MHKTEAEILLKIEKIRASIIKGQLPLESEIFAVKKEAIDGGFQLAEFEADLAFARFYFYNKKFQIGIESLEINIPKIKAIDNKMLLGKTYNILASLYDKTNDSHRTLSYFIKACDAFESSNNKLRYAETLANIGTYYGTRLHDEKKSEEYLLRAWKILKNKNIPSKWNFLYSLGSLYRRMGKPRESKKYFDLSFDEAVLIENNLGISYGYYAKSRYEEENNRYDKALDYIEKTIEILEVNEIPFGLDIYLYYKAEYLYKLERSSEAIIILEGIVNRSERVNEQAESNFLLYRIFSETKQFKKALFHFKKYVVAKNSLLNVDTKKLIETTEAKNQNKVKAKENEILKLRKWEMEQKALRAKLNPYFFFNALNAVHAFLQESDVTSASKFLLKFSRLMRKTLENSNESLISIEDEIDYLKDYLLIEQQRLNVPFQFEVQEEEDLDADFVTIPTMMIQPCIEDSLNNLKKSFVKPKIIISFNPLEDDAVKCSIEDNFPRGINVENTSSYAQGIFILESRIKNYYDQYSLKIELKKIDLKNKSGESCGRRIELLIPVMDST